MLLRKTTGLNIKLWLKLLDHSRCIYNVVLQEDAKVLSKKVWLVSVPVLLIFLAKLMGKIIEVKNIRNFTSRGLLGWKPVISIDDQLKKIMSAYLYEKNI